MKYSLRFCFSSIFIMALTFCGASNALAIAFSFNHYTGAIAYRVTDNIDTTIIGTGYGVMNGVMFNQNDIDNTLGTSERVIYVDPNDVDDLGLTVETLRGSRVFQRDTTQVTFDSSMLKFTPATNSEYAIGENFLLGTLTFENGGWIVDSEGAAFEFTLTASSDVANLYDQVFDGTLMMYTNANNLSTPEERADWVYILEEPSLGSVRVLEDMDGNNIGNVELWGAFGSLDLIEFRNPTGGSFLDDSTINDLSRPVPEPGTMILFATGLICLAGMGIRSKNI